VLRYDCGLSVKLGQDAAKRVLVKVPIATVCPCSLEMSELGAHNQRAELSIQVWQALEDQRMVWLEDLIALGEASGSGQVHTLLHTGDEKLVTDQMFRRPRFVEDVVRETVGALQRELRHVRYQVRCESMESIHAHNAVAEVSGVS
jgi:GTP cyclohydrolase I